MYKVVLTCPIVKEGMAVLEARPDVEVTVVRNWSSETAKGPMADADALIAGVEPVPADILAAAPRLRVVSRIGVGVDSVDEAHLTARGVPLCITTGANAHSVAEHTLLLLLAMAKDFRSAQDAVSTNTWQWRASQSAQEVRGKTALIIGFGHTGQAVAALCAALGMRVIAYSRSIDKSPLPGVEMTRDFRSWLPEADVISLHVPYSPETHHMLTAEDMTRIRRGAFLINVSRGGLLDESLLLQALNEGILGGVGLDVFETEPVDPNSPLLRHPRSFFTPHNAGRTKECMVQMCAQAAQNALDVLDGSPNPRMVFNRQVLGA